jgi:hypothetical protein
MKTPPLPRPGARKCHYCRKTKGCMAFIEPETRQQIYAHIACFSRRNTTYKHRQMKATKA